MYINKKELRTSMQDFSIMRIAVGALMVFTVFPVRQYARNWMAVKLGDDTPEKEGKLTLNPFAHADLFGIVFMILIGFGWGRSATINPSNFKCKNKKLGMLAVSLAGPVSNLLFAFIMSFLYVLAGYLKWGSTALQIISYIMILNLNLALFLLLPVPGFDGGDILMQFLPAKFLWKISPYLRYISLGLILLILFGPLRGVIGIAVQYVAYFLLNISDLICSLFFR